MFIGLGLFFFKINLWFKRNYLFLFIYILFSQYIILLLIISLLFPIPIYFCYILLAFVIPFFLTTLFSSFNKNIWKYLSLTWHLYNVYFGIFASDILSYFNIFMVELIIQINNVPLCNSQAFLSFWSLAEFWDSLVSSRRFCVFLYLLTIPVIEFFYFIFRYRVSL